LDTELIRCCSDPGIFFYSFSFTLFYFNTCEKKQTTAGVVQGEQTHRPRPYLQTRVIAIMYSITVVIANMRN